MELEVRLKSTEGEVQKLKLRTFGKLDCVECFQAWSSCEIDIEEWHARALKFYKPYRQRKAQVEDVDGIRKIFWTD